MRRSLYWDGALTVFGQRLCTWKHLCGSGCRTRGRVWKYTQSVRDPTVWLVTSRKCFRGMYINMFDNNVDLLIPDDMPGTKDTLYFIQPYDTPLPEINQHHGYIPADPSDIRVIYPIKYPYGFALVKSYDYPSASDVTPKNKVKLAGVKLKQNARKHDQCAYLVGCTTLWYNRYKSHYKNFVDDSH